MNPDIICISQLGNYRKIQGYPNYEISDSDTQSAVFWKNGLKIQKNTLKFDQNHPLILTQCVNINDELLLIHSYIAPDVTHYDRDEYWKDFMQRVEEWCCENSIEKIIVTGDLNTRDKRFGANHTENHEYLNELLLHMNLVNDRAIPTRENNTLDITLANEDACENILKHKVLPTLNSAHNPTTIKIKLNGNPYESNKTKTNNRSKIEYTVIDIQTTKDNLRFALHNADRTLINFEQLNEMFINAVATKITKHKPIKFWTQELKMLFEYKIKLVKRYGEQDHYATTQ